MQVSGLQREGEVTSGAAVQALSYGRSGAAYITANDVGVATSPESFVRTSPLATLELLLKSLVKLFKY